MLETMYDANGIGLAATQIAIDKRLIVMDCGEVDFKTENLTEEEYDKKLKENVIKPSPIKMINPKIVSLGDKIKEREEGGSVSNFADWKTYRQSLRDITDSATSLDDVTWPEKP